MESATGRREGANLAEAERQFKEWNFNSCWFQEQNSTKHHFAMLAPKGNAARQATPEPFSGAPRCKPL
jgi:hypothetical protein